MSKTIKSLFIIIGLAAVFFSCFLLFDTRSNINTLPDTALYQQSVSINGIGPVLVSRIVDYRNRHKPIQVSDLDAVKGIGSVKLAKLKKQFKD